MGMAVLTKTLLMDTDVENYHHFHLPQNILLFDFPQPFKTVKAILDSQLYKAGGDVGELL